MFCVASNKLCGVFIVKNNKQEDSKELKKED